ncbi:MAG: hypothetical protein ACFFDC_17235, partial [Promethearchaeota archaeon]
RLQFLGSLFLQLIFPFLKTISYDSNGDSTIARIHLIYYYDSNNIVIPFIFLLFLIMTVGFYFSKTELKYFDLMPLMLSPILSYSIFSWLTTLTQPNTLPRTEMYIELGLIIIGVSIVAFYVINFYTNIFTSKLEGATSSISEKDEIQTNNAQLRLEERLIGFLFCVSILPVAVTIPALGIFATYFISFERLTFFTAYGVPLELPESYIYYTYYIPGITEIFLELSYNPIFFTITSLVLFCISIFAARSISNRSTIQVSEIIFIALTLIFLFLINALIISLSFFLFFPWLLLPYLMIYESKKYPKQLKKGVILFILILGVGIIIVFIQVLVPIDFGLMAGMYGMDRVKIRPTFILLALPYLINKIYHGNTWGGEEKNQKKASLKKAR